MRKLILLFTLGVFLFQSCQPAKEKTILEGLDPATEKRIDDLIARMSVEEKVGQMTQITLSVLAKDSSGASETLLDPKKLEVAIQKYKVGSILNVVQSTLTRDKWYEVIGAIQTEATTKTKLKIPVLYGIDAIHGANYTVGATLFPQELALAATWQPAYAEKAGSITAYEVRASATPWNFSPVLDLGRQPLWSRFFETFGEDPYLTTQMGVAMIRGYEGDSISDPEKVAACMKHFVGYSFPFNGKDRTPILMPERLLREYYLVPFEHAIKQGAMTLMINSSEINGTPVHANYHLLTEVLKGELGYKGFAVTDWEDIVMLHTIHKVAATEKEAVKIAVMAGIDMSMVPFNYKFADYLIELVNEKQVPMERIDDAVRRILRVKIKLGLFEHPFYPKERYPKFGSDEFAQASYDAASEAITLLKNTNSLLPFSTDKKILVIGPGANSLNTLNGGWTHTWQGSDTSFHTAGKKTILQALQDKLGKGKVSYLEGTSIDKDINTSRALSAAAGADYIVVCLAEEQSVEKPGDIQDLNLKQAQKELVKTLAKSGKPLVFVLSFNRPLIISDIEDYASGVLMAYLPGDEGGRAIADILYGDVNPSGKLPFTYPRHTGSLYTYDHKFSEEKDIDYHFTAVNSQYTFGQGLSYTTFKYSDLSISSSKLTGNDTLTISVKVTNTGSKAGKEVVQVYTKDLYASITPSVKRLKRFEKIDLKPGEEESLTFKITKRDLAFVNNDLQWITEDGDFDVLVGDLKASFVYANK
ncbi:MAG TPA: glycoside hydrolase family 3 N-terminal domain-containing protein [Cytophagaceae bacterium]|jgi:beta-glucosidase|nr:glycoside hydrolase family 3 N-terminal domain-containing protein [Cytophagaceae bacterium]